MSAENENLEDRRPKKRNSIRPIIGIAVISLIICGVIFPLVITGFGQALFPYQANGELVTINGCTIGSELIAQNFNASVFFFPRPASQSASGVDPDITLGNATAQIQRISNATGIAPGSLQTLIHNNIQGTWWVFGSPYVDVLNLNVDLMNQYPGVYHAYAEAIGGSNCSTH
jgi:K+-transporting ATPase ATPase C chain